MKTLTVDELVGEISHAGGITKGAARDAITTISTVLQHVLARGDTVRFPGIGTFEPKAQKERTGRNPATGAVIQIAAKTVARFRPAKELRDSL